MGYSLMIFNGEQAALLPFYLYAIYVIIKALWPNVQNNIEMHDSIDKLQDIE